MLRITSSLRDAKPCNHQVHRPRPNQILGCNHVVDIKCSEDISAPSFKCPKLCESMLPCGHVCPGSCGRCNRKNERQQVITKHFICKKVCGRLFGTCNHRCPRYCHKDECGLCPLPCEVRCSHSKCTLKCFFKHVLHVWRSVLGTVSIKENAACLALPPANVSRAISDAPKL